MATSAEILGQVQEKVWTGSIALEIRLAASDCRTYDECDPYLLQCPRISYLAFILQRLHAFFRPSLIKPDVRPHEAWLSFQDVPLKWHYPLGLLYDIFSGAEPVDVTRRRRSSEVVASSSASSSSSQPALLRRPQPGPEPEPEPSRAPVPWCLTVHFTDYPTEQLIRLDDDGRTIHGLYINSVKEADFIRNGSARPVMSLGKDDSTDLWRAVQTHDLALFNKINSKLLNPPGMELRNVPIRVYLPTSAGASATVPEESQLDTSRTGHIRVVQSLVAIQQPSRQAQTVGTALNGMLPTIFPSKRSVILAQPVLHGAVLPMSAPVGELDKVAAYADGFLHIAVVMLG